MQEGAGVSQAQDSHTQLRSGRYRWKQSQPQRGAEERGQPGPRLEERHQQGEIHAKDRSQRGEERGQKKNNNK